MDLALVRAPTAAVIAVATDLDHRHHHPAGLRESATVGGRESFAMAEMLRLLRRSPSVSGTGWQTHQGTMLHRRETSPSEWISLLVLGTPAQALDLTDEEITAEEVPGDKVDPGGSLLTLQSVR